MFASSMMSEAPCRSWEQAPRINHWVYESIPGQISGCDGQGRVLMAIATDPLFGARLAAAFDAVAAPQRAVQWPCGGTRPPRPAFPF